LHPTSLEAGGAAEQPLETTVAADMALENTRKAVLESAAALVRQPEHLDGFVFL